jgi:hypothetical protein
MLKAVLATAMLLAAAPAAAQDWIEIAGYGGSGDKAGSYSFVDASRIRKVGERQYAAPYLEVTRKNYVERTITATCNLKLEWDASQWRDRKGKVAFDSKATSQRLIGSAAGAMGGVLGAQFAPPRKQDLLLGRWLCDAARPVAGVQFIRRPGDPKPAAWRQLEANFALQRKELQGELARLATSLTYRWPSGSSGVSSLRLEGCELKLVTASGHPVRLPLGMLRSSGRPIGALVFVNVRSDETFVLEGLSRPDTDTLRVGLQSMRGDC